MIRTLLYLIKVILLIGIFSCLASLPGAIDISWNSYKISTNMNLLAVFGFLIFLMLVGISGITYRILSLPQNYSRYRSQKRRDRGYKALLRGLTAAAIGDHKNARYLAYRAQKFLPEAESGLPILLQAQALRAMGDVADVDGPFRLLLKNAETTLLGLQGLVQNAILSNDFERALVLARDAVAKYPKNYVLLKTLYELEIRNHFWNDALITLAKALKHKIIDKKSAQYDRAALFTVLGDIALDAQRNDEALTLYKCAHRSSPDFVPAIVKLARFLSKSNQMSKAVSLIKKSWKQLPHPEILKLWWELRPISSENKLDSSIKWVEKLTKNNGAELYHSILYGARAAIADSLWGEARVLLVQCEKMHNDSEIFRLWVQLEEKTTNRPDVVRQWLDRAALATENHGWYCPKNQRFYQEWQAVIYPGNYFNALVWVSSVNDDQGIRIEDSSLLVPPTKNLEPSTYLAA